MDQTDISAREAVEDLRKHMGQAMYCISTSLKSSAPITTATGFTWNNLVVKNIHNHEVTRHWLVPS